MARIKRINSYSRQQIRELYDTGHTPQDIAEVVDVSLIGIQSDIDAYEAGYDSIGAMRNVWAEERGHKSYHAYQMSILEAKKITPLQYKKKRAKKNGHKSYQSYGKKLQRLSQRQPQNQSLRLLLKRRLEEMGRSQTWLSGQIDVTRNAISLYAQGKHFPREDILLKIFSTLEVEYKTVGDLVAGEKAA